MGNNTPGKITNESLSRKKLVKIIVEQHHEHKHKWYSFGCKDATLLMTKSEFAALSFSEKFLVKFHMFTCKYCRRFKVQLQNIKELLRSSHSESTYKLPLEKKEAINQLITKNLN